MPPAKSRRRPSVRHKLAVALKKVTPPLSLPPLRLRRRQLRFSRPKVNLRLYRPKLPTISISISLPRRIPRLDVPKFPSIGRLKFPLVRRIKFPSIRPVKFPSFSFRLGRPRQQTDIPEEHHMFKNAVYWPTDTPLLFNRIVRRTPMETEPSTDIVIDYSVDPTDEARPVGEESNNVSPTILEGNSLKPRNEAKDAAPVVCFFFFLSCHRDTSDS
jgi:hypothetical protein